MQGAVRIQGGETTYRWSGCVRHNDPDRYECPSILEHMANQQLHYLSAKIETDNVLACADGQGDHST